MPPSEEQIVAGQSVYTPKTLNAYDLVVLGVSNRLIWKCATSLQVRHYNQNISANHLDVGVGTGYFLDHCRFPVSNPRIVLMDMNHNTLDFSAARIARYAPQTHRQDVFQPITVPGKFDTIGINYLLHCLPGTIEDAKARAIDNLLAVLNPDGTLFGATILSKDVEKSWAAARLMSFYNRKGIFSNTQDSLSGLQSVLRARLRDVRIQVHGCVAMFSGRKA